MGVTAGIGYAVTPNLSLQAAYDYGLTRVDANRSVNSYNQAIKVGLAIKF
jgi:opacity protein-like surface antigen